MAKKQRTSIPEDIAASVLFSSDRTCCVCNKRGKAIQIHHIDENPANNDIANLAVLCLECHNDTQIKGGFGRKLDAAQATLYRDSWHKRVKDRKDRADELASIKTLTGGTESNIVVVQDEQEINYESNQDSETLLQYLTNLIPVHDSQLIIARSKWDSGITSNMNEGHWMLLDFYEEVLSELATFFPPGQFQNKQPKQFFNELIGYKFAWYWAINEPQGFGTGGTMASTISGGNMTYDLNDMIVQMIESLIVAYEIKDQFDVTLWKTNSDM